MKRKLLELYYGLRNEKKKKWERILPYGDLLVDRWEKARFCNFGEGSSIYDSSVVFGDVRVGCGTWIGPYTILDGSGETLEIGDHCSISSGTQIYTHNTVDYCVSAGICKKETGSVVIGNNCYIGPMCIIGKDVTIGRNSIVGANSFVNKNIPEFSIVAGNPARLVGRVVVSDDGHVQRVYDVKVR